MNEVVNISRGVFYSSECSASSSNNSRTHTPSSTSTSDGYFYSGVLKSRPEDFQVFEVIEEEGKRGRQVEDTKDEIRKRVLDITSFHFPSSSDALEVMPCPPFSSMYLVEKGQQGQEEKGRGEERGQQEEGDAEEVFGVSEWLQQLSGDVNIDLPLRLREMDQEVQTKMLSLAPSIAVRNDITIAEDCDIVVPAASLMTKEHKASFYNHIREVYPFLSATSSASSNKGEQEFITIRKDTSMLHLLHMGLGEEDVARMYKFIKAGPSHQDAHDGILVGEGISRECRTLVYRAVMNISKRLDSKTVTIKQCKCMKVFWKQPRNSNKRKNRPTGDPTAHTVKTSRKETTGNVYIWFTMIKYNMEQQEASRVVCKAVGVGTSQMNTAGIKDRRGITRQRCSITVHPRDFPSNEAVTNNDFLRVCRDNLLQVNTSGMVKFVQDYCTLEAAEVGTREDVVPIRERAGVAVGNIVFRRDQSLKTGQLWGNQFRITLRGIRRLRRRSFASADDNDEAENDVERGMRLARSIQESLSDLKASGFPNYFGSQRMGVLTKHSLDSNRDESSEMRHEVTTDESYTHRPSGPLIGKYLLADQGRLAVNTIIMGTKEAATPRTASSVDDQFSSLDQARILFYQHFVDTDVSSSTNFKGMLQKIMSLLPSSLCREIDLLRNLIRNVPVVSSDHRGQVDLDVSLLWDECCHRAIAAMPYAVKQLWVCSYQSWLWNYVTNYALMCSDAASSSSYKRKREVVNGDVVSLNMITDRAPEVLIYDNNMNMSSDQHVSVKNIVLPSIGKNMTYPENDVGLCYLKLLEREGLLLEDEGPEGKSVSCRINEGLRNIFQKDKNKLSLGIVPRGSYRHLLAFHECDGVSSATVATDQLNVTLRFSLPSGSYATSFLRELLHNDDFI